MTLPQWVNKCSDTFGRTLLAWQRLMAMRCFMPGNVIWIYVTIRHPYRAKFFMKETETMTSEERREARYQRRKAVRDAKKSALQAEYGIYEKVFSPEHLMMSYRMSRRNVGWKSSVQKYISQAPLQIYRTHKALMDGTFKSDGFYEFDIMERGKLRHIRSVTIAERVVQRCVCDYSLVPMLERTFIYDNGAAMKGKGYTFASNRLVAHLQKFYRKYGTNGYVLTFDFHHFFDLVSHKVVKGIIGQQINDERLKHVLDIFIDAFGEIGLGLGSQISQILALASANKLDHFIKEKCGIKYYARYMDDGYLIHPSKEYLRKVLVGIRRICKELGIVLNTKKTQIIKLSHGFTFLKVKYFLLKSGRIIRKLPHKSIYKMRKKLKKFLRFVEEGKMNKTDVYQSYQSWRAYASNFNSYHSVSSISQLFRRLYISQTC